MLTFLRERFHPLKHLRSFGWFRWIQRHIDRPVTVRSGVVRQRVLWLRDISYIVLREKMERKTSPYFDAIVRNYQPGLFLDVGANIGSYSWRVLNLRPGTEVWLFEPDLVNGRLVAETILASALPRVELHPVAVSARAGEAEFLVDDVSGTTGSLVDTGDNPDSLHRTYQMSHHRKVQCVTLDSFRPRIAGRRTLIKLDVEGAEGLALAGAAGMIDEVRPVIFVECFEFSRIAWIRDHGYRVHDLGESGNYLLLPAEWPEAQSAGWFTAAGVPPLPRVP